LPTDKAAPRYPLCTSVLSLEDLGAGFPLYYQFKTFTIIVYGCMFLFVSIACMAINGQEDKGSEWVAGETTSFVVDTSIGNHGSLPDNYTTTGVTVMVVLNFIFIFCIIIGSIVLRKLQNKVINDIDEKNLTPSDFGVMATHLPLDKTPEEVKEWIIKTFKDRGDDQDLEVVYVNYAYDIKEIVTTIRKLTRLQQIKAYLNAFKQRQLKKEGITEQEAEAREIDLAPPPAKYCCCMKKEYPPINVVEANITKTEEELEKIKEEMDVNTEKDLYCGTAFIVLNRQSHSDKVVSHFEVNLFRRALAFTVYNIFKCKNAKVDDRYWEGQRVFLERAAEPGDIYWENLSVTTLERVQKSFYTNLIALGCLVVAFGINLGLSILKDTFDDNEGSSTSATTVIRFISVMTSFVVVAINVALGRVVRILSAYEKHETYSKYHLSVAVKLTSALFINTGIIPLFVNFGRENWFKSGGLMDDIFWNTFTISFISPFVYLFNPVYFVKKIQIWLEERKGENSKMTQRQANTLYEGPALDMAQRYANTMLMFCMCVFYVFPLPVVSLMCFGGASLQYWIEKYILLRRHKIPEHLGATMAQVFSNMIPFFCFLYGISIFAFGDILSEQENTIGLIAFLCTLIYLFLPVRYIINRCTKDVWRYDDMTYEKHSITFFDDYNRSNPMSEKEANLAYIEKMKESGELDKQQYEAKKNQLNQGGRYGGVMNYGQQASLQARAYQTYQPNFQLGRPQLAQNQAYMMGGQGGGYHQRYMVNNQALPVRYAVRTQGPMQMQLPNGQRVMMAPNYGGRQVMVNRQAMVQRVQYPQVRPQVAYHNPASNTTVQQPQRAAYNPQPQPGAQPGAQPAAQYRPQPQAYAQPQVAAYRQPQAATYGQQPQQPVYHQQPQGYNQQPRYAPPAPQQQQYPPQQQYSQIAQATQPPTIENPPEYNPSGNSED
jgi:hypothetical protein